MRYYFFLFCLLSTSPSMAMDEEYSHPSSLLKSSSSAGSSLDFQQLSDDADDHVPHSTSTRRDNAKRAVRQEKEPKSNEHHRTIDREKTSNSSMVSQEEIDFESLKQAAANGDETVLGCLGAMYMNGRVSGGKCPENDVEAVNLLKQAAENGDGRAKINLARMYAECRGVEGQLPGNCVKVANLLRQAEVRRLPETLFQLGWVYATGQCPGGESPENNIIAVQWYELAAEEGNVPAQVLLGVIYASRQVPGKTPSESDAEAIKWLKLAAKNENEYAKLYLGAMLLHLLKMTR